MAIEQLGYEAFSSYPAGPGTVSPWRRVDTTARVARVTLTGGSFNVRIEISNAQAQTVPEHLFLPPDASAETYATVSTADAPTDVPQPVRWVRLVVVSGSVTGGNVEMTTQTRTLDATAIQGIVRDTIAPGTDSVTVGGLTVSGNVIGSGGTVVSPEKLFAVNIARAAGQEIQTASKAALSALNRQGGTITRAFADGNRWAWQASGTTNGITVISATGGGVWTREFAGPVRAAWGAIVGDGTTDDTAAVQALIDATPAKGTTDLRGLNLTIRSIVLLRSNITVDLTGTVITVPAGAVKDFWTAVFVAPNVSGWRLVGGEINCNVTDAASENDPTTGATAFVQRGLYAAGCTDFSVRGLTVRSPLMDGIRVAENCLRWELSDCRVYHRTGWTDEPAQTVRASSRPCIQISSIGYEGAGVFSGTNGTIPSLTRTLSLPQTTQRGVIYNCAAYGGTHGILLFNVRNIQVGLCRAENNSHRGIIASPTTDFVTITGCETRNSGSTGIHVANNCTNITITANTVDGVPKGEGDGIKAYVSVEQITISNNIINDVLNCGVRLAWGANYCSITGNIITMNQYGNLGSAGIKILARTRAQGDGYAAAGVNPTTARSWNNTVTGNTIRGARAGVRLGYQTPTNGTAPANNAALCEVRDNIISGNTVYGCMYGVTVYDEEYAESGSSTYIYGNTLRDLRLIATDHTTNTANASPQFASFVEIMGVPRSGNGWGSSTPIAQKQAGLNVLHGTAATPVGSYTGIAAGDRYYNTSTGAQWIFQGGAWKQVTTA